MKSLLLTIFSAGALLGLNAFAQSSSGAINIQTDDMPTFEDKINQEAPKRMEKMEIIGSHIKRTDIEGPSPVQTLDRQYIDQTGYNSAGDILREITANSFGSQREESGLTTAGGASVNLRGLGASRTLVLLDGKRIPADGVVASVDLNMIPAAAIERIDILKDGGSALYGSDAIGGVVNIVTRKNFVGTEVEIRQEATELPGGNRRTISLTHGNSGSNWNYSTSFQYRDHEKVFSRDRAWFKEGVSSNTPTANYVTQTSGGVTAPPACTEFQPNGRCRYNYADFSSSIPEIRQFNNVTSFNYDLMSDLRLSGQFKGSYKETNHNFAPGVVQTTVNSAVIDSYNLPGHNAGDDVFILWRSSALGTRDNEDIETSVGGNLSIEKELFATWDTELTVGGERIRRANEATNGYARRDVINQAIESGQINPFTSTINSIPENLRYNPTEDMTTENTYTEWRSSGELFDNWSGPVGMAFGAGYSYEKFTLQRDLESVSENVVGGGAGSNGYGTRQSQFVYTEFGIPLHRTLELNLAGRLDNFSDFGSTINPGAALAFRPIDSVLLRASASTGFKAPNLISLHRSTSRSARYVTDNNDNTLEMSSFTTGNKDLLEETSKTYSFGVVAEPTKLFNFSLDFFRTDIENQVGVNYQGLVDAYFNGEDLGQYKTVITDEDGDGTIDTIYTAESNISQTNVSGFDIGMGTDFRVPKIGVFNIQNTFSYTLKFEQSDFPTLPGEDKVGTAGFPRWKNNIMLGYMPTDRLGIAANWNMTAKHQNLVESTGERPQYTRMDAQVAYQILSKGTITVGAKNVFGEDPPMDRSNATDMLNTSLYDPIGRRFFASYKQRF